MEVVGTLVNAAVVAAVGVILAWLGKGKFEAQDRRFDSLDRRIDRLEERLDHRIDGLAASVEAMRSDLTQVALALGVRRRATNA
jgi:hypothetical protein